MTGTAAWILTKKNFKPGYMYNGSFYKDSEHTKIITGRQNKLYVDVSTGKLYYWSGTSWRCIGTAEASKVFPDYQTMVTAVNAMGKIEMDTGNNVFIVTTGVPDLWVSSVEDTSVPYTYTTDAAFVQELTTNGYVQVGHFKLSQLEVKIDLSNYYTKSDIDARVMKNYASVTSPLVANGRYNKGNISTLSLTLPATAEIGQAIEVAFKATAVFTPSISGGSLIGETIYATKANKNYVYRFDWYGSSWWLSTLEA